MYKNRNLIIPIALREACRQFVSVAASPEVANGMWVTELSQTGEAPATHAISAGPMVEELASLLPLMIYHETGVEVVEGDLVSLSSITGAPIEQLQMLFSSVEITDEDPWTSLGRLNLKIIQEGI